MLFPSLIWLKINLANELFLQSTTMNTFIA